MEEKLSYRNTVRLFAGEKCFGPGVAQLLRHVQEFHSLRSAAKAMNMAYSKAWTIVKSSERILGVQLLHTSVGGRSGGGAQLTEEAVLLPTLPAVPICTPPGTLSSPNTSGIWRAGRKQLLYLTVSRKSWCSSCASFSICAGVLKSERLRRTVPVSSVPAVRWASGAQ